MRMLCAIMAMYRVTNCVVGTSLITASIGVRKCSVISCSLFVLYVNDEWDGFPGWLHVLALIDDTVLLSTSGHYDKHF